MTRKRKGPPGAIPEELKEARPARKRRTSAFASSDPAIRERLPAEARLIADRFQLVARGAGMEAVDLQGGRRVAFPKMATGIVQAVLAGLFGDPAAEASPEALPAGLEPRLEDAALGLVLEHRTVKVDPLHPTRILSAEAENEAENGVVMQAYAVSLGDEAHGYVLCSGPERFQVAVPELQQRITAHTSLGAAFERVQVLAENYLRRTGVAPAERPRLPRRKD